MHIRSCFRRCKNFDEFVLLHRLRVILVLNKILNSRHSVPPKKLRIFILRHIIVLQNISCFLNTLPYLPYFKHVSAVRESGFKSLKEKLFKFGGLFSKFRCLYLTNAKPLIALNLNTINRLNESVLHKEINLSCTVRMHCSSVLLLFSLYCKIKNFRTCSK